MGAAMTTMLSSSRLGLLFLLSAATLVSAAPLSASCRTIHPAADFSVEAYLGKWYIQQQMETKYLPKDRNYCVVAEYARKPKSLFGYDLDVHNRDQEADGTVNNAGLWIFGRKQARNETQITLARNIATANGLDVSVLNDIDQTNCTVE